MKKNYYFATWLRAFGAVLILLCHYVGESGNVYIQHTGQIFNIGVEIFFILSGFLFGIRQYQFKDNVWHWYKRRLKRIYIPLEIFLAVLLIVYLVKGMQITPENWLLMAAGMKGLYGGLLKGANHTWFVTAILLCYLVTPLIGKLSLWLSEQKDRQIIAIFAAGGGIIPILLAVIPIDFVSTLGAPIVTYGFAYILGANFEKVKKKNKTALLSLFVIAALFCIRFVLRRYLDGTIWYDKVTTYYTMTLSSFCIFCIFACFLDKKPPRFVNWFSKISFEVYLYHYMFCTGPVKLFGLTPFWITDCMLVTVVAVAIAGVMNTAAELLNKSAGQARHGHSE